MSSRLEIIPELTNLLLDFTVSVLVNKPNDLVQYASEYFNHLLEDRTGEGGSSSTGHPKRGSKEGTSKGPRTPSMDSNHVDDEDDEFSKYFFIFIPLPFFCDLPADIHEA